MSSIDPKTSPAEEIKRHSEYAEESEQGQCMSVDSMGSFLSQSHREYLLSRHGTLDLDPIPSFSDADPYNWPTWKKLCNLILVAFHAGISTATGASIIPAYKDIATDVNISLQRASYLTSLQIAIIGGAPFLWRPLSNRFGRRPVFLLSVLLSLVCNVGCAKSYTYASMAACSALQAFFISPATALGSAVVTETFFKRDRGRYMGIWTLMVTLGVPLGPFIFGFVEYRVGYRWTYWVLAITDGVMFILYLFFGPETRYLDGNTDGQLSNLRVQYLSLRRIDPTPLTWKEFVYPWSMTMRPSVLISAVVYSMVGLFGGVLITIEVPQLLQGKSNLNIEQVGLQFLGAIIGSLLGEQIGGSLSDFWMKCRARKIKAKPDPEFRLWLSYPGILLAIAGTIVFLVCTEQAPEGKWVVSPLVGMGVASFGTQVVTTVMITYAVDCNPLDSGNVGVFVTFVRQFWGFIGPFWFSDMFETVGIAASSGITTALMVVFSLFLAILLHALGKRWRPVVENV